MPIVITMPVLSPTMKEGTIVKWLKQEGDAVESGEAMCEIATDKSTIEHQSCDDGFIRKILIDEGEMVAINQPIAIVTETMDEDITDYKVEEVSVQKEEVEEITEEALEEKPIAPSREKITGGIDLSYFTPSSPRKDYDFSRAKHYQEVAATPLAKKIAKEKNINLSAIKGSGPRGRIIEKDLEFAPQEGLVTFGGKPLSRNTTRHIFRRETKPS